MHALRSKKFNGDGWLLSFLVMVLVVPPARTDREAVSLDNACTRMRVNQKTEV